MREIGEPQLTFNYARAFSDFLTNFTFGNGVTFRSPKETEAIVPTMLQRVWEVDNKKSSLLWEVGNIGSVAGDVFIKVAYEEPWEDPAGFMHSGRVRILPLNPSFCYPEWHPHDRTRLLRFKLKYRFWGCVDTETEALTREGWKTYDQLQVGDEVLALDPQTDEIHWEPVEAVNVYDYSGHMVEWDSRISAVTTPNHRWLVEEEHGKGETRCFTRSIGRTEFDIDGDRAVTNMRNSSRLVVGGGTPMAFAGQPKWTDESVETLAWYLTEGWDHTNQNGCRSIYLAQKKPEYLGRIRRLAKYWQSVATFTEYPAKSDGVVEFYLGTGVKEVMWLMAPNKAITPEFLCSLTYAQARLFYETLLDGDGCRTHGDKKTTRWTQKDPGRQAGFQMLCAMLGKRTVLTSCGEKVQEYASPYLLAKTVKDNHRRVYLEDGKIWCPTLKSGIWFARRKGSTYWTGNTTLEGTRQVFTYVELMTDEFIEEYINDELVAQYPNPLGEIPIVHIANLPVPSSPWGLADIGDIIGLNREYNEKATDISDIINYYAAPVTVVIGAKVSNLEKGPRKVWGGLPKDARVEHLALNEQLLEGPLKFLDVLKNAMHEMTGVPVSALGQGLPVSNTSGVALSILYQPLMNRFHLKKQQYGEGFEKVNRLVIKTLALKEPMVMYYDPTVDTPLQPGQLEVLDERDPLTYQSIVHFQPPLPIDKLVALNEIMSKMQLGLESRRGALRELGEEFPDEKLQELFQEQVQDIKEQGVKTWMQAEIAAAISFITGMQIGPDGSLGPAAPGPEAGGGEPGAEQGGGNEPPPSPTAGNTAQNAPLPGVQAPPTLDVQQLITELTTYAAGTKLPQRRNPESDDE